MGKCGGDCSKNYAACRIMALRGKPPATSIKLRKVSFASQKVQHDTVPIWLYNARDLIIEDMHYVLILVQQQCARQGLPCLRLIDALHASLRCKLFTN